MSVFAVRDLLSATGQAGPDLPPPNAADFPDIAEQASTSAAAPPMSQVVLAGSVRIAEFAVLAALGLALRGKGHLDAFSFVAALAMAGLTVGLLQFGRAYRMAAFRRLPKTAVKLTVAWSLAVLAVALALIWTQGDSPQLRTWLTGLHLSGLGALVLGRIGLMAFVRDRIRRGAFDRRTAIVGGGPAAEALIHALESSGESGVHIVGVFEDRSDDRSTDMVASHPKLGNVTDLVAYARRSRIDLIVFTLPIAAEARIVQMLAKLSVLPTDIRLSAQSAKLRLRPRAYSYLGEVPVLDVFDKPLADWDVILKAAFDRSIAFFAIILLAPVLLAVALAVKLTSKGPSIFRQKRYGFNNELIEVFKFRSMYVDQGDAAAARLVTRDDPRVTRVGKFIRKTSLDELPQLFNVLRGDLSLVGPRPHALQAKAANTLYEQVVDGYFARHKVKPGITGWAQINGWRGETDTSEKLERRVEHDLHYIENWSILLDVKILFKTPFALLKTENAY